MVKPHLHERNIV